MGQHFLLSAKARTISVVQIGRMTEEEAYAQFKAVRWGAGGAKCPRCTPPTKVYDYASRRIFKCADCQWQFSATSGTIFANRKMSYRDLLTAIALWVDGVNGVSALRLGRELCCSYKTAFVLAHKLRELLGAMRAQHKLTGVVEIDGAWVLGKIRPPNIGNTKKDGRKEDNSKRRSVVTMRERGRGGRSLSVVVGHEKEAVEHILAWVHSSATVVTDEGSHWNILSGYFDRHLLVNHTKEFSQLNGVHTNWVESFNSRFRRAERGVYHHLAARHLQAYADEICWREDYRRTSNGQQFGLVLGAATRQPISRDWKGYWQRRGARPSKPPASPRHPVRPKPIVGAFRPAG